MSAAPASSEALTVGDVFLSKYEIRGLIGKGGQAAVYHGYDGYLDREVAIKVMANPPDSKRDHIRRAQLEARVLCKLQHTNIVHIYDAGATDTGLIYIIMELLRGLTLREVLKEHHKLGVLEALLICAQVADGVEVAHGQQVIHRDLKPENIFVLQDNAVKVLDFGIAKFLALSGITTQQDMLQGTMWYISPEHLQGVGVTARSDIYALGSILYEAIAGTPPCLMNLQEITTQSVAWSQISRMPPQLDTLMPAVPEYVGSLIQRMLLKDWTKRQTSMAEVSEALRDACNRLVSESGLAPVVSRDLLHVQPGIPPIVSAVGISAADTVQPATTPNAVEPATQARRSGHDVAPRGVRRWQIVSAAIAVGSVLGVILGLSKGVSKPHAQQPSIGAAQAKVETAQLPSASTAAISAPDLPSVSKVNANSAAALQVAPSISVVTMSEPAASVSEPKVAVSATRPPTPLQNKSTAASGAKTIRLKTTPAVSGKVGSTRLATDGLKPKYSGDDLD